MPYQFSKFRPCQIFLYFYHIIRQFFENRQVHQGSLTVQLHSSVRIYYTYTDSNRRIEDLVFLYHSFSYLSNVYYHYLTSVLIATEQDFTHMLHFDKKMRTTRVVLSEAYSVIYEKGLMFS